MELVIIVFQKNFSVKSIFITKKNYVIYLGFEGSMNKIGLTLDFLVATFAKTCEGFERQRNLFIVRNAIFVQF